MIGVYNVVIVNTIDLLESMITDLSTHSLIAVDTETYGLIDLTIVGLCLCGSKNISYYIPIGHKTMDGQKYSPQIPLSTVINLTQNLLSSKTLVFHNYKFDYKVLKNNGWNANNLDIRDTMILQSMVDERVDSYKLKSLGKKYLIPYIIRHIEVKEGVTTEQAKSLSRNWEFTEYKSFSKEYGLVYEDPQAAGEYGAQDAWITFMIYRILDKQVQHMLRYKAPIYADFSNGNIDTSRSGWDSRSNYVYNIEHNTIQVLAEMEEAGIDLDVKHFKFMYDGLVDKMKMLLYGTTEHDLTFYKEIDKGIFNTKYRELKEKITKDIREIKNIVKEKAKRAEQLRKISIEIQAIEKTIEDVLSQGKKVPATKQKSIEFRKTKQQMLESQIKELDVKADSLSKSLSTSNLELEDPLQVPDTLCLTKYMRNPNSEFDIAETLWYMWNLHTLLPKESASRRQIDRLVVDMKHLDTGNYKKVKDSVWMRTSSVLEDVQKNLEEAKYEEALTALKTKISSHDERSKAFQSTRREGVTGHEVLYVLSTILKEDVKMPKNCPISREEASQYMEMLLDYRKASKALTAFVIGIMEKVKGKEFKDLPYDIKWIDDRLTINAEFKQLGARSGRMSCKDPNLQQSPRETDEIYNIRKGFIPRKGCVFVCADYKAMEMRVAAAFSQDPIMCDLILNEKDPHTVTASIVFNKLPEEIDPKGFMRVLAKTMNFTIIYGGKEYALFSKTQTSESKELRELTLEQCKEFIDSYNDNYKVFHQWALANSTLIENRKWSRTLGGRYKRVDISNFYEKEKQLKAQGAFQDRIDKAFRNTINSEVRSCLNTIIQGSCATIMKAALTMIYNQIQILKIPARIVLSVHDEIVIEVLNEPKYIEIVKELCEAYMPRFIDKHNPFYTSNLKENYIIKLDVDIEVKETLSKK